MHVILSSQCNTYIINYYQFFLINAQKIAELLVEDC